MLVFRRGRSAPRPDTSTWQSPRIAAAPRQVSGSGSTAPFRALAGSGRVLGVAFSPDGRRVVAGFGGVAGRSPSARVPRITVFDAETGTQLHQLTISGTGDAVFSQDATRALVDAGFSIGLYDTETGQQLLRFSPGLVHGVAFLPGRTQALVGDYELKLWDLASETGGIRIATLRKDGEQGENDARRVAVSSDGKWAASLATESFRGWDLRARRELWRLAGCRGNQMSVAFSPDGTHVVQGCPGEIRVIHTETGKRVAAWTGFKGNVLGLAFSPNGQYVLSGDSDDERVARLWEFGTGRLVERYPVTYEWTAAVAFSPDGRRLLAGAMDEVRIWEMR